MLIVLFVFCTYHMSTPSIVCLLYLRCFFLHLFVCLLVCYLFKYFRLYSRVWNSISWIYAKENDHYIDWFILKPYECHLLVDIFVIFSTTVDCNNSNSCNIFMAPTIDARNISLAHWKSPWKEHPLWNRLRFCDSIPNSQTTIAIFFCVGNSLFQCGQKWIKTRNE